MRPRVTALVLIATLAGCLGGDAAEPAPAAATPSTPTRAPATSSAAAAGAEASALPFAGALHLQPDGSLAEDAPATAGHATIDDPVHSPETDESAYPVWEGKVPGRVNVTEDGLPIVLYLTSSGASARANLMPIFSDAPGVIVEATLGNMTLEAHLEPPEVLTVADVVEVRGVLKGYQGEVPAGAAARVIIAPLYTSFATAAEVRVVMGPDAPSRVEFG